MAESLRHMATTTGNAGAAVLGDALDAATGRLLEENKSPARRVGQLDNRGSHAWLATYWAQALADQSTDAALAAVFAPVAAELTAKVEQIEAELIAVQGHPVDLGGYYRPDAAKTFDDLGPSPARNIIKDTLS